tara:strand:- start:219 stop:332 length:114 start_codon:yes stop_codon:yes gene_type:complete
MTTAIPIIIDLVSVVLSILGLREIVKEVTISYSRKLG